MRMNFRSFLTAVGGLLLASMLLNSISIYVVVNKIAGLEYADAAAGIALIGVLGINLAASIAAYFCIMRTAVHMSSRPSP
jgi:hypothetical protein